MEVARSRQPSMPAVGDAVINQVFGLLPPADADLLQRRLVDDVEPADLADELGISRAAVDQRVSRAKARLKAALAAQPELLAELRAGHPHIYRQRTAMTDSRFTTVCRGPRGTARRLSTSMTSMTSTR